MEKDLRELKINWKMERKEKKEKKEKRFSLRNDFRFSTFVCFLGGIENRPSMDTSKGNPLSMSAARGQTPSLLSSSAEMVADLDTTVYGGSPTPFSPTDLASVSLGSPVNSSSLSNLQRGASKVSVETSAQKNPPRPRPPSSTSPIPSSPTPHSLLLALTTRTSRPQICSSRSLPPTSPPVRSARESLGLARWREYAVMRYGDSIQFQSSDHGKELIKSEAIRRNLEDISSCTLNIEQLRGEIKELEGRLMGVVLEREEAGARVDMARGLEDDTRVQLEPEAHGEPPELTRSSTPASFGREEPDSPPAAAPIIPARKSSGSIFRPLPGAETATFTAYTPHPSVVRLRGDIGRLKGELRRLVEERRREEDIGATRQGELRRQLDELRK